MKNFCLLISVLLNFTAYAQQLNVHKDINAFFNELSTTKHYKIKKINHKKLKWRYEGIYNDSLFEGILKNDSIQKYLTSADLIFIED